MTPAVSSATPAPATTCPGCATALDAQPLYQLYRVCDICHHHFTLPAKERITQLADPGSFHETHRRLAPVDPLSFSDRLPYRERLRQAQQRTGLVDAAVTGTATIGGRPVVLAALDFHFLGGSMGSVVGEKIALAGELALRRRAPLIAATTSGGARMQEGLLSLMQMAKTAGIVARLHAAGVPFISLLAGPVTGGVYASFASLGDLIIAEPGGPIGFAGPRVAAQTAGHDVPDNERSAAALLQRGQIDMVVERPKLRPLLGVVLDLLGSPYQLQVRDGRVARVRPTAAAMTPWQTLQLARHQQRPTACDYIARLCPTFVELHGDRLYADDPAVVCGLADLGGASVVIIGQERGHGAGNAQRREGHARPEGYRKALRLMRLAGTFHLPVVAFVDTPGADVSLESEQRGLANAIAQCMAQLSELPSPVVAVVIGEGGSGGALALAVANRVLMLEHAVYSVISPEGCAAILFGDATRAEEVAPELHMTAQDGRALGVVDVVVPEPPGGAHLDHDAAAHLLRRVLLPELLALQQQAPSKLVRQRQQKFRAIGRYARAYRVVLQREMAGLGHLVRRLRPRRPRRAQEAKG
ncbi:MAG: acetyl-CoA carboxylase carboxyl transferase subunit beta [Chloroflexi bacterium]|nr:acetyl-CoA carboxylase carboxyl transferase subunit beta [Chloroflexota bacterium]